MSIRRVGRSAVDYHCRFGCKSISLVPQLWAIVSIVPITNKIQTKQRRTAMTQCWKLYFMLYSLFCVVYRVLSGFHFGRQQFSVWNECLLASLHLKMTQLGLGSAVLQIQVILFGQKPQVLFIVCRLEKFKSSLNLAYSSSYTLCADVGCISE